MFLDPNNGLFSHLWRAFGAEPISFLSEAAMPSIILIVSWQWLPFATLILLTAIQSLDSEQLEAAEMDGAPVLKRFWFIVPAWPRTKPTLPSRIGHLAKPVCQAGWPCQTGLPGQSGLSD